MRGRASRGGVGVSTVYQTDVEARRGRIADIVTRRHLGETVDEIGSAHGITHQRVCQILEKHAPDIPDTRPRAIDPIAAMRLARSADVTSLSDVAERLGVVLATLRGVLHQLGVLPALSRLYRIRRGRVRRQRVVEVLRRFAMEHGRAPTVREMQRCMPGFHTNNIYAAFESLPAAFAAAGLQSRPSGMHGRVGRQQMGGAR